LDGWFSGVGNCRWGEAFSYGVICPIWVRLARGEGGYPLAALRSVQRVSHKNGSVFTKPFE